MKMSKNREFKNQKKHKSQEVNLKRKQALSTFNKKKVQLHKAHL